MSLYPTKYSTDSRVNERMIEFYRERACGGVAMIVLDCPCLDYPNAYKGPDELRFDTPEFAEGIRELLNAIHAEGAKAFMQLNYPKERVFKHEVPGAEQKGKIWVAPLAEIMTSDEAREIIDLMAEGAKRAREVGYDGIEIQASYGDFISQLLSPLSNKRTDEYGGSINNRARFLIDLIKIDQPFVFNVRAVYERILELGTNTVILGGGDTGCETADLISSETRNITIVELLDEPLQRMKEIPKQELLKRLKERGISIITNSKAIRIQKGKVIVEDKEGIQKELRADSVILSIGNIPADSLFDSVKGSLEEVYLVGDADNPGNLGAALRSSTEVALKI